MEGYGTMYSQKPPYIPHWKRFDDGGDEEAANRRDDRNRQKGVPTSQKPPPEKADTLTPSEMEAEARGQKLDREGVNLVKPTLDKFMSALSQGLHHAGATNTTLSVTKITHVNINIEANKLSPNYGSHRNVVVGGLYDVHFLLRDPAIHTSPSQKGSPFIARLVLYYYWEGIVRFRALLTGNLGGGPLWPHGGGTSPTLPLTTTPNLPTWQEGAKECATFLYKWVAALTETTLSKQRAEAKAKVLLLTQMEFTRYTPESDFLERMKNEVRKGNDIGPSDLKRLEEIITSVEGLRHKAHEYIMTLKTAHDGSASIDDVVTTYLLTSETF